MSIINDNIKLSEVTRKKRFDSEYFQPDFVNNENKVRNTIYPVKKLSQIAYITDGDHSTRKYLKTGVRFLTSENFSEFVINYETDKYLSEKYEMSLKRSRAEKDAIFITKTGRYYGKASICIDDNINFNIPADVGKIRILNDNVSPYFVVAFLNSKYGYTAIRRENSGGTRDRITLINLGKVEIPLNNDVVIETTIKAYIEKVYHSQMLYEEARKILDKALDLDSLASDYSKHSVSSYASIITSRRIDSQHFQARYTDLIKHLSSFPCEKIRNIRTYNRRGVQPIYIEKGSIDVVNSQHISKMHIKYDELQKTSESFFLKNSEGHIKENDLLIYTTGAYVGQTNIYLKNTPALASNHVNILRVNSDIDPAYISMIFQSLVGQLQTKMHSRGSAQAELYPSDIDKFVIPIIACEQQKQIGNLVRNSLLEENESKLLLIQVINRIECLIENSI